MLNNKDSNNTNQTPGAKKGKKNKPYPFAETDKLKQAMVPGIL